MKDLNKLTDEDFVRLGHQFWSEKASGNYNYSDIEYFLNYLKYVKENKLGKGKKVALLFVCLNEPYWEFAGNAIASAKKLFLPGHDVDYFLWSDMPKADFGATLFETEPVEWPLPTLYRYHLFLQQEAKLAEYDYIFYVDADMLFVNVVGDEILGEGLTAAQHPMYAIRKEYIPPYEPNTESSAYISRPGRIVEEQGKPPLFEPLYFAGGFQGGKAKDFISAMKTMKGSIDKDFAKNYVAIWNDESHWNKYLFDKPPAVVLSPSYVYPDSLIEEYYLKIWGCNYPPKLVTLTKKFSTTAEGGEQLKETLKTL